MSFSVIFFVVGSLKDFFLGQFCKRTNERTKNKEEIVLKEEKTEGGAFPGPKIFFLLEFGKGITEI
jgi:hypothetical protein